MGLREDLRGTWFDEVMSGIGRVAERGFRAAAPGLDATAHVATMPARAVTAAGHEVGKLEGSEGAWEGDPLDYILYGYDPETGQRPAGYGELLGEAVERDTDLPIQAAEAARLLGTAISDPVTVAGGVAGVRGAANVLSRRARPAVGPQHPVGLPTQGQVYPQYAPPGAIPTPPATAAPPPPPPPTPPVPLGPPAPSGGAGGVGGIPYMQLYKWFRG
jgi:hypothetical protein